MLNKMDSKINHKINVYYKFLGMVLFAGIMVVLGLYWDFSPVNFKSYKIYNSQIYANQLSQLEEEYKSAMAVFPLEKDFDASLEVVKKMAESNHLQITLRKSGTVVQRDFYGQIPVQMTLVGSYQQILNFMTQTENSNNSPVFIWQNWVLTHQYQPKTTVLNETDNNDLLQLQANTEFFYRIS